MTNELFKNTAKYYSQYRIPYAPELFERITEYFDLGEDDNVLDLGCGTGQIALPLANLGPTVFGVDPDIEMLCEAIHNLGGIPGSSIRWMVGNDSTLSQLKLPKLRLCAMGASFHWMDRPALLGTLDKMVGKGGGVAILSGGFSAWSDDGPAWNSVVRETVQEFLGQERRAGNSTYAHPKKKHEDILSESAFSEFDEFEFTSHITMTVDKIIGFQLSTSYASSSRLGDKIEQFKNLLAKRLYELEPSGKFASTVTHQLIAAKRKTDVV